MDWIGVKVDWIKKIRFFAHPYQKVCQGKTFLKYQNPCKINFP